MLNFSYCSDLQESYDNSEEDQGEGDEGESYNISRSDYGEGDSEEMDSDNSFSEGEGGYSRRARGRSVVLGRNKMNRGDNQIFEKNQKSLFKEIETCEKYCETHYYNEISNKDPKKLSKRSEFYSALVEHILSTNPKDMRDLQFLTYDFIYSSVTLTDLMAVLALIDLPWHSASDHSFEPHGERGIQIVSKTNMLIYKKELQNTDFEVNENLIVIHRFFDEDNRDSEMKITEFLPQRVYG
jgi:hypothetical protein